MSVDQSSLDMMKSFDRTRQQIASFQPPTDPLLIRQFCERFCNGEIDRFELQMNLLVLDTAAASKSQAPKVPRTPNKARLDSLSIVLKRKPASKKR